MALQVPNIDKLSKESPRLGEALLKVQNYTNENVTAAPGNIVTPPAFANPTQRPG